MPKQKHPDTKQINGQAAVRVDSPYPHWPGCVYVPRDLSPDQYDQWWRLRNEERTDSIPAERWAYMTRHHMVLEWYIDGVEAHHVTPEGDKLPAAKLWAFVVSATQPILEEARSLPNLPGSSNEPANGDD